MKAFQILSLVLVALGVPLWAQDGPTLYKQVAPEVLYLRHELKIEASRTTKLAEWKHFEKLIDNKILGEYFPVFTGSGFFVDDDGRLITNRHVAEVGVGGWLQEYARSTLERWINNTKGLSAAEKTALISDVPKLVLDAPYRFSAWNAEALVGEVTTLAIARKSDPDLALVQVTGHSGGGLALATDAETRDLAVGTEVASFGYPLGSQMDHWFEERVATMNRGSVSALRPRELLDVQHSASISGGNSGGPLVDARGRVVGVNTASADNVGGNSIFYAVSASKVREFLIRTGWEKVLVWNQRLAALAGGRAGELGTVRVTSSEEGATVWTLGRSWGVTPLDLKMPPGSYDLEVRKEGRLFPVTQVSLTAGAQISVHAVGVVGQVVEFRSPDSLEGATLDLRGPSGFFRVAGAPSILVPEGAFDLTATGQPGLIGVRVPVQLKAGTVVDLAPSYLQASLEVRGWEPGATVTVNGKTVEVQDGKVSLPVAKYRIAVTKPDRQPLLPLDIHVRAGEQAFVTWKPATGYESLSRGSAITAVSLGLVGAALGGYGWYFGQDSLLIPDSSSYSDYVKQKEQTQLAFQVGVGSVAVAVILEGLSLVWAGKYEAQKKELAQ